MKSRFSGLSYIFIFLIIISSVIIAVATDLPMKANLLPMGCAIIVLVLAAVGLVREIFKKKAPVKEASGSNKTELSFQRYLIPAAWILGYTLGIYLIGLLVSTVVLIFSYTRTHQIGWPGSIITTVVASMSIYFIFQNFLSIDLYPGLVLTWLRG